MGNIDCFSSAWLFNHKILFYLNLTLIKYEGSTFYCQTSFLTVFVRGSMKLGDV